MFGNSLGSQVGKNQSLNLAKWANMFQLFPNHRENFPYCLSFIVRSLSCAQMSAAINLFESWTIP